MASKSWDIADKKRWERWLPMQAFLVIYSFNRNAKVWLYSIIFIKSFAWGESVLCVTLLCGFYMDKIIAWLFVQSWSFVVDFETVTPPSFNSPPLLEALIFIVTGVFAEAPANFRWTF